MTQQARLAPNEVHLFATLLDDWRADTFRSLLTSDEVERAERFRFERDHARYIVGRGLLRCLLASYVGGSPGALRFRYTEYGKPQLDEAQVSFNLAHSQDRALFAVGPGFELGIDVEVMDSTLADESVAEHFFTPMEVADLNAVEADDRARAFLTCWTRKEAFIKARGEGLSLPLHDFAVTLLRSEEPRVRWTAWSETEPDTWRLVDLSADQAGYVAALAARSPSVVVAHRDFGDVATPSPRP